MRDVCSILGARGVITVTFTLCLSRSAQREHNNITNGLYIYQFGGAAIVFWLKL